MVKEISIKLTGENHIFNNWTRKLCGGMSNDIYNWTNGIKVIQQEMERVNMHFWN